MKRAGDLWDSICTFENALDAYGKARAGKRYRHEVIEFEQNREENLFRISSQLRDMTYAPGRYKVFKIFEPKERTIMALPFRDRVAQHMICNYIEPVYEKRFYEHSYACRVDKGVHEASSTLQRWIYNLEVVEGRKIYALKCDIHHYFQSVDHRILKEENRRYFKDKYLLQTLDLIIDHNGTFSPGKGIPVGNLTSQLFANVYLNVLDDYIKHELGCKYYIRYMDDFIILSESVDELREIWKKIEVFIGERLLLSLNPKTTIVAAKNGVDFVGYRHYSRTKKIRKAAMRRMRKLLRQFEADDIGHDEFYESFQSRTSSMGHADAYSLIDHYVKEADRINGEEIRWTATTLKTVRFLSSQQSSEISQTG